MLSSVKAQLREPLLNHSHRWFFPCSQRHDCPWSWRGHLTFFLSLHHFHFSFSFLFTCEMSTTTVRVQVQEVRFFREYMLKFHRTKKIMVYHFSRNYVLQLSELSYWFRSWLSFFFLFSHLNSLINVYVYSEHFPQDIGSSVF